ncbi:MAG TPA: efflux RND transporter periplasmic adaptor subunit [Thermoanaerobaculia bacterium]|jgi:multidrug efflux pump subunit AcrA (membrane-fusion protein)|nr:efflux RND transporter periplasmic adaptor subunit [Thermoanaerobaculia bacterium]
MSRRTAGTGLLVLVALAGAAWLLAASLPHRAPAVPIETVRPRDFARLVPAEGVLRSVHSTPVSVPVGAPGPFRVGWIADDGTRVKAGEPVIRFDPSEIEKELENAADELATARVKAEKERAHGLAEVRKLERDLALAHEELSAAREFQKKDETVYSRIEITESEIDEELARNREAHARETRRGREALSGTELELLGIDMRKADAKIRRARESLAALTVTAPHDGVLVLKRNWRGEAIRVGDTVWNGQPLAEIPDLAQMQAEVYVLEADAGGLAPGKPATVSLESRPDVEHAARIGRVDPLAKPRFRGSPVQYFGVTLSLDRTDPGVMKPGQRVRALLRLDERPRALTVPRQAVFERDGKTILYRMKGEAFEPVEVALGPSGAGRVVVESGLRPGDAVALADPTRPLEPAETQTPEAAGAPTP